ncbi:hypothetical protein COCON_G00072870, partial [Conger conger]
TASLENEGRSGGRITSSVKPTEPSQNSCQEEEPSATPSCLTDAKTSLKRYATHDPVGED